MKKLFLSLALLLCSTTAFAQHRGGGGRVFVAPSHIVISGGFYGGYYGPAYGWYPYSYYGLPVVPTVVQSAPCKKEKLKDSDGKKHDVLVCRQPDGSFQVVADADKK